MNLKQFLKTLKLNESVVSMGLGALIVIITGILVFNYLVNRQDQTTPVLQIGDEPITLPTTHTVAENETLWDISKKYFRTGYNWTDIAQANNITNADQIEVGQILTIPNVAPKLSPTQAQLKTDANSVTKTPTSTITTTPVPQISEQAASTEASIPAGTHKVEKGENLWKIAEKYYSSGYNWVDIARENSLKNPYFITVGQELKIPDAASKKETVSQPKDVSQSQVEAITSASYIVVKGDSLWKIAVRAYGDGYKWVEIAKENNLLRPNLIHSGNVLRLPR